MDFELWTVDFFDGNFDQRKSYANVTTNHNLTIALESFIGY